MELKPIKTITSHVGYGRFLCELQDTKFVIDRTDAIPSPYCYSPSKAVSIWQGKLVVMSETRHKHYVVFLVPEDYPIRERNEFGD